MPDHPGEMGTSDARRMESPRRERIAPGARKEIVMKASRWTWLVAAACLLPGCNSLESVSAPGSEALVKPCIDDLRSVRILSPREGDSLEGPGLLVVEWAVEHICTEFVSTVEIRIGDAVLRFSDLTQTSLEAWLPLVPNLACGQSLGIVVSVTVRDELGEVRSEVSYRVLARCDGERRRGQERD